MMESSEPPVESRRAPFRFPQLFTWRRRAIRASRRHNQIQAIIPTTKIEYLNPLAYLRGKILRRRTVSEGAGSPSPSFQGFIQSINQQIGVEFWTRFRSLQRLY